MSDMFMNKTMLYDIRPGVKFKINNRIRILKEKVSSKRIDVSKAQEELLDIIRIFIYDTSKYDVKKYSYDYFNNIDSKLLKYFIDFYYSLKDATLNDENISVMINDFSDSLNKL